MHIHDCTSCCSIFMHVHVYIYVQYMYILHRTCTGMLVRISLPENGSDVDDPCHPHTQLCGNPHHEGHHAFVSVVMP